MAKLIYVANVSLDGYIEDAHGSFEWTAPSDEVFTFITDLVRPVGTYLYGRRLYETMAVWEADPTLASQSELMADFANLASGRQDRLLHDAERSLDRRHAA
jgi:dihydrofolate reductase